MKSGSQELNTSYVYTKKEAGRHSLESQQPHACRAQELKVRIAHRGLRVRNLRRGAAAQGQTLTNVIDFEKSTGDKNKTKGGHI